MFPDPDGIHGWPAARYAWSTSAIFCDVGKKGDGIAQCEPNTGSILQCDFHSEPEQRAATSDQYRLNASMLGLNPRSPVLPEIPPSSIPRSAPFMNTIVLYDETR